MKLCFLPALTFTTTRAEVIEVPLNAGILLRRWVPGARNGGPGGATDGEYR